jgi:hypothetical protein
LLPRCALLLVVVLSEWLPLGTLVCRRFVERRIGLGASGATAGSSGLQGMAGLAVIVLGILAVSGTYSLVLTLIALLIAGAAILMTGSTLSGTMIGFMRSMPQDRITTSQRIG